MESAACGAEAGGRGRLGRSTARATFPTGLVTWPPGTGQPPLSLSHPPTLTTTSVTPAALLRRPPTQAQVPPALVHTGCFPQAAGRCPHRTPDAQSSVHTRSRAPAHQHLLHWAPAQPLPARPPHGAELRPREEEGPALGRGAWTPPEPATAGSPSCPGGPPVHPFVQPESASERGRKSRLGTSAHRLLARDAGTGAGPEEWRSWVGSGRGRGRSRRRGGAARGRGGEGGDGGRGRSGAGRAVGAGGGRGGQDAAAQGAGGDAEGLEWEPPEAGRAGAQLRFATRRPAGRSVSVSPSGPCRNLARPHPSPAVGRPAPGRGARLLPHFCCSELLSELNFVLFSSWSCFLLSLPHISCPLTSQSSLVAGVWSVGWACI